MTPRVRFAPSPTGLIHVGNVRTAALNWLYARKHGGSFLLRLDDTDVVRSTEKFADAIRDDLKWLGLTWDKEVSQQDRTAVYSVVADALKASGVLYPCFETEEELDCLRKRQLAMRKPPIYDRAALRLSDDEIATRIGRGEKPHWRFHLPNPTGGCGLTPQPTLISWNDLIRGDQTVNLGSLSDPVLIREDGTYLYMFSSVVDDIAFGITHIVRGEDHITNTGVQMAIFEAVGATPPAFGHHSLLVGADGQVMSKRFGMLSIQSLRDEGLEPMAVLCHAALIGTSDAIEPFKSRDELAAKLDFVKISTAPGRFDIVDLKGLNSKLFRMFDYADVANRLCALGIEGREDFWSAVRGNLNVFADARLWWDVVMGGIEPIIEDSKMTVAAASVLPPEPWSEVTWSEWTRVVKSKTGATGKALFHPLRLALTGCEAGPELKFLLPLMGRDRVLARLEGKRA